MTTFTLSELGCNGNCQQGRLPCTCLKEKQKEDESLTVNVDLENGESKVEIVKKFEF
jgi:hypothetical protein